MTQRKIVELSLSGRPFKELSSEYRILDVTIYKVMKDFTPISSEKETLTLKQ